MPTPNDTSSESSPRDVANAALFGTDTIPTVEISTPWKIGPGGCDSVMYTVLHDNRQVFSSIFPFDVPKRLIYHSCI